MLRLTINGLPHTCDDGVTILGALRAVDIDVPTLCDDPRLKPCGACRLCVVEVEGYPRPQTACNSPVVDGMQIQTHTPELEQSRLSLLRLLAQEYPSDAVRSEPNKPFHRYLRQYGVEDLPGGKRQPELLDESHPYIRADMSQCIYCYRCVRICDEVQGQSVWQVWNRGCTTRIRPDSKTNLLESSCVSCGACVDTCPTGALEDRSRFASVGPLEWTRTVCPYCGTGCEMNVGTRDQRIVQVTPVYDAPVSKGHLCVKGRYAFAFNDASDRITEPMIRGAGGWNKISWDEAIAFVADGLRRIIKQHGPDSVGVLGSARATNEDNYLAQKFARVVVGTNNVDCCARVCHAPSAAGLKQAFGTGAATNSFDDIERAKTILLCGANATENHPIVGARIKQAALHGAHLLVIDPRRIELAEYADCHLQLQPGTNIPLLNAMANTIVEEGLYDQAAVSHRTNDWDAFQAFIRPWTPESVALACGIDASLIRRAARIYATEKPAICFHGLGITEHVQGTDGVLCLANLALLTGNFGKPGTGVNPLRGQNNVQGAAMMGCEPDNLLGSLPIEKGRDQFEQAWGVRLPDPRGLNLMQMMDRAVDGQFKALWAIGYDVALTNPNANVTARGLRALDLVIVQDLFLNQLAAEFGSVFLPAASPFEKDGTFMNAERRIQRVRKAAEPTGQSKPDWQIICALARAMGHRPAFGFSSAQEVWNEVRMLWPAGRGISYERLERGGLQWPCTSEDHPGTAILHTERFATSPRAPLSKIDYQPTSETIDDQYPFLLNTGRTLYQFNAGTMTMRTKNVVLRPTDVLEICVFDAQQLGLQEGEAVRISSRYGQADLPIHISSRVRAGQLFATFHTATVFLNRVTGASRDARVGTPEYKITAVNIQGI